MGTSKIHSLKIYSQVETMITLDTFIIDSETLTPQEFLSLGKDEKKRIINCEIVAPKLGDTIHPYGAIKVFYDEPRYTTNVRK